MVFWGKVVGNEHVKVEIPEGGSVYLLQVCLSSISEITSLYVKPCNEKKGFLICHLGASNPQFSLCHELVAEDSPLEMWTTGGQLHVTGTTQEEEGDEEDCSQDDEDEEEEPVYAEECAPTKNENTKTEKRARVVEPVEFAEPTKKTKTTKGTQEVIEYTYFRGVNDLYDDDYSRDCYLCNKLTNRLILPSFITTPSVILMDVCFCYSSCSLLASYTCHCYQYHYHCCINDSSRCGDTSDSPAEEEMEDQAAERRGSAGAGAEVIEETFRLVIAARILLCFVTHRTALHLSMAYPSTFLRAFCKHGYRRHHLCK